MFALALSFTLLFQATPARADDEFEPPKSFCNMERGTYSATIENDIFAGNDSDYTSGVRLSYITPCDNHFFLDRWASDWARSFYSEDTNFYGAYAIGQNIYTPREIATSEPDPNDRPYAGFLYGSIGLIADDRASGDDVFDMLDTFAIDVGVVGDAANAEFVQTSVHELFDQPTPKGWNRQIEDEPGVRVLFERKWRFLRDVPSVPVLTLEVDAIPHVSASLGNVNTSAAAGALFRIGSGLRDDYGPPRVRPGLAGPGFFDEDKPFGWSLFAGGEVRAVARDIFLDGNTFRESRSVAAQPIYAELIAGGSVQVYTTELSFSYVLRSPQHESQSGWSQFGAINFLFRF